MFDPRHTEVYHQQMQEIIGWMAGPKRDVTVDQLKYDIREVIRDLGIELYDGDALKPDMHSSHRGYYVTLLSTLHAACDGGTLWPYAMTVVDDCPWGGGDDLERVTLAEMLDDAATRINVWDIANGYEG